MKNLSQKNLLQQNQLLQNKLLQKHLSHTETFKSALITTFPVFLGYMAIGMAFGFMLVSAGYHWLLAPLMSTLIYAGAGQYLAVSLFASNAQFIDIITVTLLVNSRHMVYGFSLFSKFRHTGIAKFYLIYGLSDETYSLLTTVKPPQGADSRRFYFYITLLDHLWWILGGTIGALLVNIFKFNTKGVEFALTALFVVLMIEQYKNCDNKLPFVIAIFSSLVSLILIGPQNMLIISIILSIIILISFKRVILK